MDERGRLIYVDEWVEVRESVGRDGVEVVLDPDDFVPRDSVVRMARAVLGHYGRSSPVTRENQVYLAVERRIAGLERVLILLAVWVQVPLWVLVWLGI